MCSLRTQGSLFSKAARRAPTSQLASPTQFKTIYRSWGSAIGSFSPFDDALAAWSSETASIDSIPSSYLRPGANRRQQRRVAKKEACVLVPWHARPTYLPSLGPRTLMPIVRTFVRIISICSSDRSPELVRVKSENGIRTSVQECAVASDAGFGSHSRCWNRSDRTTRGKGEGQKRH